MIEFLHDSEYWALYSRDVAGVVAPTENQYWNRENFDCLQAWPGELPRNTNVSIRYLRFSSVK